MENPKKKMKAEVIALDEDKSDDELELPPADFLYHPSANKEGNCQ